MSSPTAEKKHTFLRFEGRLSSDEAEESVRTILDQYLDGVHSGEKQLISFESGSLVYIEEPLGEDYVNNRSVAVPLGAYFVARAALAIQPLELTIFKNHGHFLTEQTSRFSPVKVKLLDRTPYRETDFSNNAKLGFTALGDLHLPEGLSHSDPRTGIEVPEVIPDSLLSFTAAPGPHGKQVRLPTVLDVVVHSAEIV